MEKGRGTEFWCVSAVGLVFECAAAFQVIGDARGPHILVAHLGFDAGLARAPLDHPVSIRLPHALRRAGGSHGPEYGPVWIARDAGPANPYDNARCESFIKTLKYEEIYASEYGGLEHLRTNLTSHRALL